MLAWLLHKQTPKVCLQLSRLLKLGKTLVSEIVLVKNNGMHCPPILRAKFEAVNLKVICKWLRETTVLAITAQVTTVQVTTAQVTTAQATIAQVTAVRAIVVQATVVQEIVALATVAPETGVQAKP